MWQTTASNVGKWGYAQLGDLQRFRYRRTTGTMQTGKQNGRFNGEMQLDNGFLYPFNVSAASDKSWPADVFTPGQPFNAVIRSSGDGPNTDLDNDFNRYPASDRR